MSTLPQQSRSSMPNPSKPAATLPTSRTFLTSLLSSISAIPLSSTALQSPPPLANHPSSSLSTNYPRLSRPRSPPCADDHDHDHDNADEEEEEKEEQGDDDDDEAKRNQSRSRNRRRQPRTAGMDTTGATTGNPLRRVPASHRHLVVTLHVLFPGLVLPALDLLERGLVARVVLAQVDGGVRAAAGRGARGRGRRVGGNGRSRGEGGCVDGDGEGELGGGDLGEGKVPAEEIEAKEGKEGEVPSGNEEKKKKKRNARRDEAAFYLVTSASSTPAISSSTALEISARDGWHRQGRGTRWTRGGEDGAEDGTGNRGGGGRGGGAARREYIVRLNAWHCSCAAFAFAAVQGNCSGPGAWEGNTSLTTGINPQDAEAAPEPDPEPELELRWSFGGLSSDGLVPGEGVPVCKHLLACVLADRWGAVVGRYVVERRVGKQEMAGIVAEV